MAVEFRVIVLDVGIVSMPTDLVTAMQAVRTLLGRGRKAILEVARQSVPACTVMIVRAELLLDPAFDFGVADEPLPFTSVHGEIESQAFDELSSFALDAVNVDRGLSDAAVRVISRMQKFLLAVHRDRFARINAKTVEGSYTLN